jgi:hypothetical protein
LATTAPFKFRVRVELLRLLAAPTAVSDKLNV